MLTTREVWSSRVGVKGFDQHQAHAAKVGLDCGAVCIKSYPEYIAALTTKLPRSGITVEDAIALDGFSRLSKAEWTEARSYLDAAMERERAERC